MRGDILYEGLTAEDLIPEAREAYDIHLAMEALVVDAPQLVSIEDRRAADMLETRIYQRYIDESEFVTTLTSHIREIMEDLTDREREVLGLRVLQSKTLREVGEIIGNRERGKPLSPSRMWHIEHEATAKLHTTAISARIAPFLE